jgi:hypothetical protein
MPQPPLPGGRGFQKPSHGLEHYKIEPRLAPLISIISFNYPLYELVRMECRPFQPIRESAQIVCQVLTRFSDPVTLLAPSSLSSYPSQPMASQVVWPLNRMARSRISVVKIRHFFRTISPAPIRSNGMEY